MICMTLLGALSLLIGISLILYGFYMKVFIPIMAVLDNDLNKIEEHIMAMEFKLIAINPENETIDSTKGDNMTNAEKFEEIFGFKPDTEFGVIDCPHETSECSYYEELDGGCHCESWWNETYKRGIDKEKNG